MLDSSALRNPFITCPNVIANLLTIQTYKVPTSFNLNHTHTLHTYTHIRILQISETAYTDI